MAGVDSAGLGEVMQNVLARFPDTDKGHLVKVDEDTWSSMLLTDDSCYSERFRDWYTLKITGTGGQTACEFTTDFTA